MTALKNVRKCFEIKLYLYYVSILLREDFYMKWKKYTIETTTAAEDFMSSMLMELGIEGIEIEDNIPLTKEDQADMFIDFLPELPPDEGISHVSFILRMMAVTSQICLER